MVLDENECGKLALEVSNHSNFFVKNLKMSMNYSFNLPGPRKEVIEEMVWLILYKLY